MHRLRFHPLVFSTLVVALSMLGVFSACGGGTTTTTGRAYCNGELDIREETVDDAFDQDGDGYFDAAIADCTRTYEADQLDCNDSNADIHPGQGETICNDIDDDCDESTDDAADEDEDGYSVCDQDCNDQDPLIAPGLAEVACDGFDNDCDLATSDADDFDDDGFTECDDCVDSNAEVHPDQVETVCDGLDNDCDPATVDGTDGDGDGSTDCFDCDDGDTAIYPGAEEICDDGIDQDCNGSDSVCDEDNFSGNWTTNAVLHSCGGGNVNIDFDSVSVQDDSPDIVFVFIGGLQPGAMNGSLDESGHFSASVTTGGVCSVLFTLEGDFLGANSFSATLSAPLSSCSGCGADFSQTVTGTR